MDNIQPVTESQTGRQVKERIAALKAQGKVETLSPGTEADAARSARSAVHNGSDAQPDPDRIVEPKTFPVMRSMQSGIPCYTLIMTFQDCIDYGCLAEEGYENGTDTSVMDRYQRYYDAKRGRDARDYLLNNEVHLFPGLLAVPTNGLYDVLADLAQQSNGEDGSAFASITLTKASIAWLDGQHRFGGIRGAIAALKSPTAIKDLSNESLPVSILRIDPSDLDTMQQLFSDVNKNPKKSSKAENLAMDHIDPTVRVAKRLVADLANSSVSDLGRQTLVDFERTSGKKSESVVMSFVNLNNLLKPNKNEESKLISKLSPDELTETIKAVIFNLPMVEGIRQGTTTLGQAQLTQICYYSTIWQALGRCLNKMVSAEDEDGNRYYQPDQFASVVHSKMRSILNRDGWLIASKTWQHPDRPVVTVMPKGKFKVNTSTEYVKHATEVLENLGLRVGD